MMNLVASHARVVAALVIREMSTRFGNKAGGYLWAILDPAAHIALMTFLFSAIARVPSLGTSFPLFFAGAFMAFQMYATMSSQVSAAISANRNLLSYPVVAPIDTVLARYALQSATMVLVTILVLAACLAMMNDPPAFDIIPMIEALFIASAIGLGVGMMNIVLFHQSSLYEKIFSIVNRPMFLLSGVFFLPESIPQPYRDYLLWNPLIHVTMWFRTGLFPYYDPVDLDRGYAILFAMSVMAIGGVLFTAAESATRPR